MPTTRDYIGPQYRLDFKGQFCVEDFYKILHKWFDLHRYDISQEKEHKQLAGIDGKRLILVWVGEKDVTDYYRFVIDIEIICDAMKEVTPKGAKKCIHDCHIHVLIKPSLVRDYEERWSTGAFSKFMRELFDKFISKSQLETMEQELANDARMLRDELAAFFDIKTI